MDLPLAFFDVCGIFFNVVHPKGAAFELPLASSGLAPLLPPGLCPCASIASMTTLLMSFLLKPGFFLLGIGLNWAVVECGSSFWILVLLPQRPIKLVLPGAEPRKDYAWTPDIPWMPRGEQTVIARLRVGRERCVRFCWVNGGWLCLAVIV